MFLSIWKHPLKYMNSNLNDWEHTPMPAQLSNLFGDKVEDSFKRYPKKIGNFWNLWNLVGSDESVYFWRHEIRYIWCFYCMWKFSDSCCSALTGALSYPSAAAQADLKVLMFRSGGWLRPNCSFVQVFWHPRIIHMYLQYCKYVNVKFSI